MKINYGYANILETKYIYANATRKLNQFTNFVPFT